MENEFREDYENLFVYLRKCDLPGFRLNLEVGRAMQYITLEGKSLLNRFEIDMNDVKREVKVYEWIKNKDRIKKIENSETVEYPLYITNIKKYKENDEEKARKR